MVETNTQNEALAQSTDVHVFITHKTEHSEEAEKLVKALRPFGGSRLHFKLSTEMQPGERWRIWIRKNVSNADVLFFIAPRPNVEWSWPIYEAGLFEGSPDSRQDSKRIVLVHSEFVRIPTPLEELQAVPAKEKNVVEFLKKFFGESTITGVEPPLNKDFAQDKELLTQTAKTICKLFLREQEPSATSAYCTPHVAIQVANSNDIAEGSIPEDAVIECDPGTLEKLGIGVPLPPGKSRLAWSDFRSKLAIQNEQWLDELVHAIHVTNRGGITPRLNTTFRDQSSKIYLPVLYQVDDETGGSRRFHIIFVKQVSEGMFVKVPDVFATLLTSLTLGSRLEWEVCREYLGKLERWKFDQREKARGCEQIREAIANIENEAEYRQRELSTRVQTDRLVLALPDEQGKTIRSNLAEQGRLKQFLAQTGAQTELAEIQEALEGLFARNQEIMILVSIQYCALLQRK